MDIGTTLRARRLCLQLSGPIPTGEDEQERQGDSERRVGRERHFLDDPLFLSRRALPHDLAGPPRNLAELVRRVELGPEGGGEALEPRPGGRIRAVRVLDEAAWAEDP